MPLAAASAQVAIPQRYRIVRFCGVCLNPLRIVTEFYGNGSLAEVVSNAENKVRGGPPPAAVDASDAGPPGLCRQQPADPSARRAVPHRHAWPPPLPPRLRRTRKPRRC
jgi:hypothetical protein